MAVTQNSYTRDGSATNYSFTFPYLDKSDVKVRINGVTQATTAYSFANATTLTMGSAGSSGDKLVIFRDTNNDSKKATFYAGSAIKSEDLNDNYDQILYVAQEVDNNAMTTDGTTTMTANLPLGEDVDIVFEGGTDNAYETTLTVTDPTADRTITLPNETGTVITTASTNVIDSDHYVDGSIDSLHISNDSIDSQHYAAGSIDLEHMSANSVDSAQYVDGSIDRVHLSADIIDGTKIEDNAINSEHYAAGSIDLEHMSANSVDSDQYVDGSIDAVHLSSGSVINVKLATDSVTSGKIAANAVGTSELADDAVTADIIASNAITASKIADDVITTDHIADAELTTLAGMQAGTASILAGGTALTSTLTELNQLDGKTLGETTLTTNSDTAIPTSKAVNDRIVAVTNALGGFVAIADKDNFPTSHPDPGGDAGTVVSISNAAGISVNSSGVGSLATRAGGSDAVVINGFPSALRGGVTVGGATNADPYVLPANVGLQVQTTSTAHTYDYHKYLINEEDANKLSGDIQDFQERYRVASSAPTSNNDDGDLYFDTSAKKMKVYNATTSQWDDVASSSSSYIVTLSEAFDGSRTDFTMSTAAVDAQSTIVSINGVIQKPNAGTSTPSEGFAISSNTLKLSSAPPTGSDYFVVVLGDTVSIGTPSDNTVSTAKIQNLAVDGTKIATNLDVADSKTIRFGTDNDFSVSYNNTDNQLNVVGTSGKKLRVNTPGSVLNLDCETNVTGSNDINFVQTTADPDLNALYLGYQHGGNGSRIGNKHSSGLKIWSDKGEIAKESNTGYKFIEWNPTVSGNDTNCVNLYYADSKKFETTNTGVLVTGNVGIGGTPATGYQLDITGQSGYDDIARITAVGTNMGARLNLTNTGTGIARINATNNDLALQTGGTSRIVVDSAGSVGIKNTSPESQYFNNLVVGDNSSGNWGITIRTSSSNTGVLAFSDTDSADAGRYDGYIAYEHANQEMAFYASGANERLRITSDGYVRLPNDTQFLQIGAGQDLDLHHNGTNSFIRNKTGDLHIRPTAADEGIILKPGGATEIYHDGEKKINTAADGATVTGALFISEKLQLNDSKKVELGTGGDLQLWHDATDSHIKNITGYLTVNTDSFAVNNGADTENQIIANANGAVKLYYDSSPKLETTSTGVKVDGALRLDDAKYIKLGDDADVNIFHNGANFHIQHATSGSTYMDSIGNHHFRNAAGDEYRAKFTNNGSVDLYYNGNKKFETTDDGAEITGYIHAYGNKSDAAHTTWNKHSIQIETSGAPVINIENSNDSNPYGIYVQFSDDDPDNQTNYFLHAADSSASRFKIWADGDYWSSDGGTINSDRTLKENIVDATPKLEDLKKIKVRNFNFKEETHPEKSKKKQIGFIAQEVETVFPALVSEYDIAPGMPDDGHTPVMKKAIKDAWTPILVKALQEAITKIETLETKVAALEAK